MTAILIEDDNNLRKGFEVLLKKHASFIQLVDQAGTTKEGFSIILKHQPEILFLDIQLTDGSSFDILEKLHQVKPEYKPIIVFITAYQEYAIKAFKFSALEYILKPIDQEEFKQLIQKIQDKKTVLPEMSQIALLLQNMNQEKQEKKIALYAQNQVNIVVIQDIIRCASDGNYTTFYRKNEKEIVVSKPLKEYEELLAKEGFERIHHSHLINVNYIKTLQKNDLYFVMQDGSQVPISSRKKERVYEIINQITL